MSDLQQAIDAASDGDLITLAPGSEVIGDTLEVTNKRITIIGDPSGSELAWDGPVDGRPMIHLRGCNGGSLFDFTLRGREVGSPRGIVIEQEHGSPYQSTRCRLERLYLGLPGDCYQAPVLTHGVQIVGPTVNDFHQLSDVTVRGAEVALEALSAQSVGLTIERLHGYFCGTVFRLGCPMLFLRQSYCHHSPVIFDFPFTASRAGAVVDGLHVEYGGCLVQSDRGWFTVDARQLSHSVIDGSPLIDISGGYPQTIRLRDSVLEDGRPSAGHPVMVCALRGIAATKVVNLELAHVQPSLLADLCYDTGSHVDGVSTVETVISAPGIYGRLPINDRRSLGDVSDCDQLNAWIDSQPWSTQ